MCKAFILTVVGVAILVGCKRLGIDPASPDASAVIDGQTPAQYNTYLIAGILWPIVAPFIRHIPVVGPIVQPFIAELAWKLLATKKQKEADKA